MKIIHKHDVYNVQRPEDIENIVRKLCQHEGASMWLCDEAEDYPAISIMGRGSEAAVYYFVEEGDAGFQSVNKECLPELKGTSVRIPQSGNASDDLDIPREAMIPLADALKTASEFCSLKKLPSSIEWLKL